MSSEPELKTPPTDTPPGRPDSAYRLEQYASEQETKTTDGRRAKMQRLVEEYSVKVGLGKIQPSNDVEKYLNLTEADLRRMSAEDCGIAAYIVAKAMTYVQLQTNQIQADMNWCNQYIQWMVAKVLHTVGGQYTPVEYKRLLAIQQNDTAQTLYKVVINAQAKLDSMAFVTTQLRGVLNTLEGLQQTKRGQR